MKKILVQVFIIISLFTISSCTKAQEKELQLKEELVFDVGYDVKPWFLGNFYDKDSNLFFYFSEPVSHKEIQIFNREQQLVKKISLKHIDYLYLARMIKMPSMDSIIISIAEPLQLIYVLDSNANILYRHDFPLSTTKEDGDEYNYNEALAYNNGYVYMDNNHKYRMITAEQFVYSLKKVHNEMPIFSRMRMDTVSHTVEEFGNYNNKIYKYETSYRHDFQYCKIENDKLFHFTSYTNKVAITDLNNLDSVKIVSVYSKYTPIGLEDFRITEKTDVYNEIYVNGVDIMYDRSLFASGRVFDVLWDKYRQLYYFFIKTKYSDRKMSDYGWIIQVFDKDFNFIRESKIRRDRAFVLQNNMVLQEGLLLNCDGIKKEKGYAEVYRIYDIDF